MNSICRKPLPILFLLLSQAAINNAYAEDDHGNSCGAATTVNIGTNNIGELTSDDTDFFKITLPGDGRLTVFTSGETNTTGKLFNSDGLPLEEDFSDGSGNNFLISKELDVGSYCLQIRGGSSSTNGLYSLRVEGDFFDDDHGSSCENAEIIADPRGTTIIGELTVYADVDYFRINTPTSGHITVFTNGETNTTGKLFDINGIPLEEDFNDGSGNNFLISRELEAGSYCFAVYGGTNSTNGTYSLQVEGDFFDDDHGTDCGSATVVSTSSIFGELSKYSDSDYFRIKIPESGGTLITYTEGETNTTAKLYDENGIFLEEDFNDGSGNNFRINRDFEAGNYCLEVFGNNKNTSSNYTLITEGDFVPVNTLPPLCSGQTLYDTATGILTIPNVRLGNSCYSVKMEKRDEGFTFDLTDAVPAHR